MAQDHGAMAEAAIEILQSEWWPQSGPRWSGIAAWQSCVIADTLTTYTLLSQDYTYVDVIESAVSNNSGQDDLDDLYLPLLEALNIRPLLGIPEELDVVDMMCFGPPLKASYKRWKKPLEQIVSWDRFNHQNLMTVEQIEDWVKTRRHKVMYRDETNVD